MPDEHEETIEIESNETDSDRVERGEGAAEAERTLEEIGEELLARLDELDAKIAELSTRVGSHEHAYAGAEHKHEYADKEHEHEGPETDEHEAGRGEEEAAAHESAPRSNHLYYRKWPPWKS